MTFLNLIGVIFKWFQLEEAFSEVGPVRRCFLVTNKGENLMSLQIEVFKL